MMIGLQSSTAQLKQKLSARLEADQLDSTAATQEPSSSQQTSHEQPDDETAGSGALSPLASHINLLSQSRVQAAKLDQQQDGKGCTASPSQSPAADRLSSQISSPGYHSAASSPSSSASSPVSSTSSSSTSGLSSGSSNCTNNQITAGGSSSLQQSVSPASSSGGSSLSASRSPISPNLLDYYPEMNHDGLNLSWYHDANSRSRLATALLSDRSLVAGDISLAEMSRYPVPIMARPPLGVSDLTLENWLQEVTQLQPQRGIKLTFTSTRTVEPAFRVLARHAERLKGPVILSADILARSSGTTSNRKQQQQQINQDQQPVDAWTFLMLCRTRFPRSIISIGWCSPESQLGQGAAMSCNLSSSLHSSVDSMFELDIMDAQSGQLQQQQQAGSLSLTSQLNAPSSSQLSANYLHLSQQLNAASQLGQLQQLSQQHSRLQQQLSQYPINMQHHSHEQGAQQQPTGSPMDAAGQRRGHLISQQLVNDHHNHLSHQHHHHQQLHHRALNHPSHRHHHHLSSLGSLNSSGNSSGSPSPTSPIGHLMSPAQQQQQVATNLSLGGGGKQHGTPASASAAAVAALVSMSQDPCEFLSRELLVPAKGLASGKRPAPGASPTSSSAAAAAAAMAAAMMAATSGHFHHGQQQLPLNLNINEQQQSADTQESSGGSLGQLAHKFRFGLTAGAPSPGSQHVSKKSCPAAPASKLQQLQPPPTSQLLLKTTVQSSNQQAYGGGAGRCPVQQQAGCPAPGGANCYTRDMIDKMASLVKEYNLTQPVTFPVEAKWLKNSLGELQRLLYQVGSNSTLTVIAQQGDLISVDDLLTIRKAFATNQILFDLPQELANSLKQKLELLM